jgi:hypothetical protein
MKHYLNLKDVFNKFFVFIISNLGPVKSNYLVITLLLNILFEKKLKVLLDYAII